MAEVKPIETVYNGYRFRSRLEARWAVFFDSLHVKYEYEPQGFLLPSGRRYLPDFKVKCYGTRGEKGLAEPFDLYVEVKGFMSNEDADKIIEFATRTDDPYLIDNPVLVVRTIPPPGCSTDSYFTESYDCMDGTKICPFNYQLIDGDYFAAYPAADKNGHFYLWGDDSNYINFEDIQLVEDAYTRARQARFEHGEMPRV